MAAGGGATSAYKCQVNAYELTVQPTTTLRTQCVRLDQALAALARGEQVNELERQFDGYKYGAALASIRAARAARPELAP